MTRRGCLWFAGGLVLAVLAGVLAFVALLRVSTTPKAASEVPKVQVLVAARDIPLQTVLVAADVTPREVSPEMVPEDALADPDEAVGQMTTAAIARDEVILRRRLIKPDYVGPQAAFVMDPTKVIVAFPATDLLSSIDIIRPGDRVDVMFSFKPITMIETGSELMSTMTVLQDIKVAAVVRAPSADPNQKEGTGAPRALLLALDPQDALTLKYFRDNGGGVDLALRSPAAPNEPFDVLTVDGQYILQRYQLRGR